MRTSLRWRPRLAERELVIAWGGDGTINEVGRALVQCGDDGGAGQRPALGMIPGGSGNGLARELRHSVRSGAGYRVRGAIARPASSMRASSASGCSSMSAGIGLDAHVAALVSTRINHRGLLPYLKASAGDLLRYRPVEYTVTADGKTTQTPRSCSRSPTRSSGALARRSRRRRSLDDGWLDLVIVEDRRFLGKSRAIPSLFLGGSTGRRASAPPACARSRFARATDAVSRRRGGGAGRRQPRSRACIRARCG